MVDETIIKEAWPRELTVTMSSSVRMQEDSITDVQHPLGGSYSIFEGDDSSHDVRFNIITWVRHIK